MGSVKWTALCVALLMAGASAQTTAAGCGGGKADILFILDASGSVGAPSYVTEKNFVKDIIRRFKIGATDVQVAAMHFSSSAIVDFYFNTHSTQSSVLTAVDNIPYTTGGTATDIALKQATDTVFQASRGDRPDAANIAIVITDGGSNSPPSTAAEAARLKAAGVLVFGIGVGSANDAEMASISSLPTANYYFKIGNFGGLQTIVNAFSKAACQVATAAPTTTTTTTTTTTMPTTTTPLNCASVADITFVVDGSGSISSTEYQQQIDFIVTMVNQFDIGPSKVKVAVVSFASGASVTFGLDAYLTKSSLIAAVKRISKPGGNTNTDAALSTAKTSIYNGKGGDRYYAPDIVIVLTDGSSNNQANTLRTATDLKNAGITIFSIGVGSGSNLNELQGMANQPSSQYVFTVTDFTALDGIKASLAKGVCKVADATPVVQASCTANPADVMFVVDTSLSVGKDNFNLTKEFLKELMDSFDLTKIQVGLVLFNKQPTSIFKLNDYSTPKDVKKAIDATAYIPGQDTITSSAITFMRDVAFTQANGDRPNVPDIGVLVTDGQSKEPYRTHFEANKTKNENGITLFAVGIGSSTDLNELKNIASDPDTDFVHNVKSFASLASIETKLIGQICKGYIPPNTATTVRKCEDTEVCFYRGYEVCREFPQWARTNCPVFCSMCPAGSVVVTNAPVACVDVLPNCASFDLTSICFTKSYRAWAGENCRKTCSLCNLDTLPPTTPTTTTLAPSTTPTTTTTPIPTTSDACHDTASNCFAFPDTTCKTHPDWAKKNCIRRCQMCPGQSPVFTPPPCDDLVDCASFGTDVCTDHVGWSEKNCRSHCRIAGCTPAPKPCVNSLGDSACLNYDFSSVCVDPDYRIWAENNCRKMCKLC